MDCAQRLRIASSTCTSCPAPALWIKRLRIASSTWAPRQALDAKHNIATSACASLQAPVRLPLRFCFAEQCVGVQPHVRPPDSLHARCAAAACHQPPPQPAAEGQGARGVAAEGQGDWLQRGRELEVWLSRRQDHTCWGRITHAGVLMLSLGGQRRNGRKGSKEGERLMCGKGVLGRSCWGVLGRSR